MGVLVWEVVALVADVAVDDAKERDDRGSVGGD
jgi:hypothetical protein